MVYGHLVVSIILTYSTMWNFIILLCLATECNTFEWIIFVLHLQRWFMYYSIAVHAYSADNNYHVKIARSALRLTELTIQAVKPKNHTTQSHTNLHNVWRPFFFLFLNSSISKNSSCIAVKGLDSSDSISYFRFKCPTPPGQGLNFPPTERPFWSNSPPSRARIGRQSNVRGLSGRGGCWNFELIGALAVNPWFYARDYLFIFFCSKMCALIWWWVIGNALFTLMTIWIESFSISIDVVKFVSFSFRYWVWIDRLKLPFVTLKNLADDFCRRLMLQEVGFFARLYATGNPPIYVLTLCCFPLHLKEQVQNPLSPDLRRVCAQGGGNSRKPLCKEDWMSLSLSEAFTLMQEENLDNFLKWVY